MEYEKSRGVMNAARAFHLSNWKDLGAIQNENTPDYECFFQMRNLM